MISTVVSFLANLLVVLSATAGSTTTISASGDPSESVEATADQALRSIKTAELSGADVSGLIDRFNAAIELQEQAENDLYENCPSHNDCATQANDILLSIVDDAASLGSQAAAKKEQPTMMLFTIYVPVSSFIASVAIVGSYRAWKSWRARRFEKMNINERKVH
jgi:hypothetical protein